MNTTSSILSTILLVEGTIVMSTHSSSSQKCPFEVYVRRDTSGRHTCQHSTPWLRCTHHESTHDLRPYTHPVEELGGSPFDHSCSKTNWHDPQKRPWSKPITFYAMASSSFPRYLFYRATSNVEGDSSLYKVPIFTS